MMILKHLKLNLIFLLIFISSSFAYTNNIPNSEEELRRIRIILPGSVAACALIASPGDFILQTYRIYDDGKESFGYNTKALVKLKEIVSLSKFWSIDYAHAELIYSIIDGMSFSSVSYYPEITLNIDHDTFQTYVNGNDDGYRDNYAVYRIQGDLFDLKRREGAIKKVLNPEDFPRPVIRTCSDFVNWAYNGFVSTWINFIPGVRRILSYILPGEIVTTPDDLANSLYTKKLCEFKDMALVYPKILKTKEILERAIENSNSNPELIHIKEHGEYVINFLVHEGVITPGGEILYDEIEIVGSL